MTFKPEYLQFAFFVLLLIILFIGLPWFFGRSRKDKRNKLAEEVYKMAEKLCSNYHDMDNTSIIDAFLRMHEHYCLPLAYKTQSMENLTDVMYFLATKVFLKKEEVEKMSQMLSWEEVRRHYNVNFRVFLLAGLVHYDYDSLLPAFVDYKIFLEQELESCQYETCTYRSLKEYEIPEVEKFIARFAERR